MTVATSEIAALRESYREARTALERMPDSTERDIGLAALRLEATAMYRGLVTTAQGFSESDRAILDEYVSNLVGGEGAERAVGWLDSQAKSLAEKTLSSLMSSLASGVLVGFAASVLGAIALIAGVAMDTGAALAGWVLTGGSAVAILGRTVYLAMESGQEGWVQSWSWAQSLGTRADVALASARSHQERVWLAATGAPWRLESFTAKARSRAELCVGIAWLLLGVAIVLVAIGAFEAFSSQTTTSTL